MAQPKTSARRIVKKSLMGVDWNKSPLMDIAATLSTPVAPFRTKHG